MDFMCFDGWTCSAHQPEVCPLCLYALVRGGVLSRFALMARRAVPAFSTTLFSLAYFTHVWQRSSEILGYLPYLLLILT